MKTFHSIFYLILLITKISADICTITKFEQVLNATKTCTDIVLQDLVVPGGVTLKLNLLKGTNLVFNGTTLFEFTNWFGPLVTINGTGLRVSGGEGSIIDGQGKLYWDGKGGSGTPKPQFFTIEAFDSVFSNFTIVNTPKDVVQVTNSDKVEFYNWFIDDSQGDKGVAPKGHEGHHTDGFDVWNSTNVIIENLVVFNQDDCLAIRCGANITVSNLWCHGSHGLSISVGFSPDDISVNTLKNVTIKDSYLVKGMNGIHIKTHNDGGPGLISDITYKNITFDCVERFGVQIQQNYPRGDVVGNVPIDNLNFIDVRGGVADTAVPVFILCAEGACDNWHWTSVQINGTKPNHCNYEPEGFQC
ncbi:unnamed protein product [Ceutorhynchus assimilis]|uniref:endo-polygalacturonase n=1 Tax=Ceutorhynchus assimilis TaxID=467358 RepID=A0A9N9QEH2_9CUCU|nr:unnamed protein product [Ceutorhynchus assimilis]